MTNEILNKKTPIEMYSFPISAEKKQGEEQSLPAFLDTKKSSPIKELLVLSQISDGLASLSTLEITKRLLTHEDYLRDDSLDLSEVFNFDLFNDSKGTDIAEQFANNSLQELERVNFADKLPNKSRAKLALHELAQRAFKSNPDHYAQTCLCHLIIHQKITCSAYRAKQLSALAAKKLFNDPEVIIYLELTALLDLMQHINRLALAQSGKHVQSLYDKIDTDPSVKEYLKTIKNPDLTLYLIPNGLQQYQMPDFVPFFLANLDRFHSLLKYLKKKKVTVDDLLKLAQLSLPVQEHPAQSIVEAAICRMIIDPDIQRDQLKEVYKLINEAMEKKNPSFNDVLNYCKMGKHCEWAYFRALALEDKGLAHSFIYKAVEYYQQSQHEGYLRQLGPAMIRLFTLRSTLESLQEVKEKTNSEPRYLELLREPILANFHRILFPEQALPDQKQIHASLKKMETTGLVENLDQHITETHDIIVSPPDKASAYLKIVDFLYVDRFTPAFFEMPTASYPKTKAICMMAFWDLKAPTAKPLAELKERKTAALPVDKKRPITNTARFLHSKNMGIDFCKKSAGGLLLQVELNAKETKLDKKMQAAPTLKKFESTLSELIQSLQKRKIEEHIITALGDIQAKCLAQLPDPPTLATPVAQLHRNHTHERKLPPLPGRK